ncbi:MAG: hypothetical protein WC570_05040 [Patescibacteria group bacterium]
MKGFGRILMTVVVVALALALIYMASGFLRNVWPSWWDWILSKLP